MRPKQVLFLEPFYGGSHRDFADGLISASSHRIILHSLPARFWKWRMRGAALHFADKIRHPERFDVLLTSTLLSLADLKAIWGPRCPPALVYFHENQLDYPLGPAEARDYQYGFTNLTTSLCAERILFNSHSHHQRFFGKLRELLRSMPDCRPGWILKAVAAKSSVLYPGCRFDGADTPAFSDGDKKAPPLIIWNHRWEFDKAPEVFFQALESIDARGIDFRLALLGERFRQSPPVFAHAIQRFENRLAHSEFVASKKSYYRWLRQGAIVVSTALQENFGIAVVEAMRFGCLPLLPARLSYPEILPPDVRADVLYEGLPQLVEKLAVRLLRFREFDGMRSRLSQTMACFSWDRRIGEFDRVIAEAGKRG